MITRLPGRGTVLIAVAFVLASVLLTLYVWRSVGGDVPLQPKRYEVRALFDNASQLVPNADVRISGVNVGKVVGVEPHGLRTEARLAVESRFAPLPSDVRAILRQKTLLGETFVELTPGSASAPELAEGATIPRDQIADTQPLDRVLGMLDTPTRERIKELLTNSATMFEGRGSDINAALGNLELGTRQLGAVVEIVDSQRGSLETLLRDTGAVMQTFGDQRDAVRELVRSGHSVLSATADRGAALTASVREAPRLLRELRETTVAAERTAALAAPVLSELRPVAPMIPGALRAARDVSPQLGVLLEDFEELLPTTRKALPAAASIVDALAPMMDVLEPTAAQIVPVVDYVAAYRRELVATMANMASATNAKGPTTTGGRASYLRTLIPLGLEGLIGQSQRLGSNRHNAYREPGGLAGLAEGLTSAGCEHADPNADAPPCKVQPGWSFQDDPARYYQHLQPARAGGAMARLSGLLAALRG